MEKEYLSEFKIDMNGVKEHYINRKDVSKRLKKYLRTGAERKYVELAVGITEPLANYSAHEHKLGPKILCNNTIASVFNLAQRMSSTTLNVTHLPKTIYQANLLYLKISVGSEMASLLQPDRFWVGNVRTIWSHLVIKHEGDWKRANEELELYHIGDVTSEMNYQIWRDIYLSMEHSLDVINAISATWSEDYGVEPGNLKYIWIDAICNALYEERMR